MIAHILGKGSSAPCQNTTPEARKIAQRLKKGKGKRLREESGSSDDDTEGKPGPKKKLLTKVETSMKQSQLKVFRGIHVPFTDEQRGLVHEQFLRATISANLPFRWVEDPEVLTLFLLFRSTASDVIPSRKQIAGQILDNANLEVLKRLKAELQGEYAVMASDGWKDDSRNAVSGVNLSVGGKVCYCPLLRLRKDLPFAYATDVSH